MNHALFPASGSFSTHGARSSVSAGAADFDPISSEDLARLKRLRSLLALFSLYAAALLIVVTLSDGADIGCILGGIAGHVLYATHRVVASWRDAAWLEDAKLRTAFRLRLRMAR